MESNTQSSYTQLHRSFSILLLLVALLSVAVFVQSAWAIQASPHAFVAEQPDGTKSTLYIRGDEYLSWCEDTNGYTVLHDGGKYVYAELDNGGRLVPTNLVVGQSDPKAAGLSRKIRPWPAVSRERRSGASFQ